MSYFDIIQQNVVCDPHKIENNNKEIIVAGKVQLYHYIRCAEG